MSGARQQTVARDEDGMRLDRWFGVHFPEVTFGHLQKLIRTGQVRIDSARAKTNAGYDYQSDPYFGPTVQGGTHTIYNGEFH